MSADVELPLGPSLEFMRGLWRLNHALERLSSRMSDTIGVTAQQRMILRCVGRFPGVTPGQLARVLHLDAGTISAALRRLERKGLLERRRVQRDRRRVTLGLTARGREIDRTGPGTVEGAVTELLERASAKDLDAARGVLTQLTALLEAAAREPTSGELP